MRREMARYGMRVVCIEPGFTDTPLLDTSRTQQGADMTQTRLTDLFATVGNQQALKDNIGEQFEQRKTQKFRLFFFFFLSYVRSLSKC